jgi:hypothetical protein
VLARSLQVTGEQRLDDRLAGQLGVLGCLLMKALKKERGLDISGALAPQRAVIVEYSDPVCGRDVVAAALLCDAVDEVENGRLRGPSVPRWQRVGQTNSSAGYRPEVIAASSFSIAWSIVKLAAFWRGGNSAKVARKRPTSVCAASTRNALSSIQSQ